MHEHPYESGISEITGKNVTIRHGMDRDVADVRGYFKTQGRSEKEIQEDVQEAEIVVAVEETHLIGFGILKKSGDAADTYCISITEMKGHEGIGVPILKHMLDYVAVDTIHAAGPAEARYLAREGFFKREEGQTYAVCGRERPAFATYTKYIEKKKAA